MVEEALLRDPSKEGKQATESAARKAEDARMERVAAIMARAFQAISSGNPQDLDFARFEVEGEAITSAELAVAQSFVNGVINEVQARQLLTIAQQSDARTNIETVIERAKEVGILNEAEATRVRENAAAPTPQAEQPTKAEPAAKTNPEAPVAEKPVTIPSEHAAAASEQGVAAHTSTPHGLTPLQKLAKAAAGPAAAPAVRSR